VLHLVAFLNIYFSLFIRRYK